VVRQRIRIIRILSRSPKGRRVRSLRTQAKTRLALNSGILDAAKVTRVALQNAAAVAGLLTTEVMIAKGPKEGDDARRSGR
jgi:chaperonin GroEL (HSP60 family)